MYYNCGGFGNGVVLLMEAMMVAVVVMAVVDVGLLVYIHAYVFIFISYLCLSHWSCGLRRRFAIARLL